MEERQKLIILYDFYSDLLKENQRKNFEDYYFNNLSLGEISENEKVSRNAIHKSIKKVEKELENYEDKLKLYKKSKELELLADTIKDEELRRKIKEIL